MCDALTRSSIKKVVKVTIVAYSRRRRECSRRYSSEKSRTKQAEKRATVFKR